jgi:hypothetical protein
MTFEGEDWFVVLNLLLSLSIRIVPSWEIKICASRQHWLRESVRREHHPDIPKFNQLVFRVWYKVCAIISRFNTCDALWVTDESTRIMIVINHSSLVPNPNYSAITARSYHVAGLILIFIHVASEIDPFFMSLIKSHDLSVHLIVIDIKLAKSGPCQYFFSIPLKLNRTKIIHLAIFCIVKAEVNNSIPWIFHVN